MKKLITMGVVCLTSLAQAQQAAEPIPMPVNAQFELLCKKPSEMTTEQQDILISSQEMQTNRHMTHLFLESPKETVITISKGYDNILASVKQKILATQKQPTPEQVAKYKSENPQSSDKTDTEIAVLITTQVVDNLAEAQIKSMFGNMDKLQFSASVVAGNCLAMKPVFDVMDEEGCYNSNEELIEHQEAVGLCKSLEKDTETLKLANQQLSVLNKELEEQITQLEQSYAEKTSSLQELLENSKASLSEAISYLLSESEDNNETTQVVD